MDNEPDTTFSTQATIPRSSASIISNIRRLIVPQLIDMTYKVHLGLFEEDVLLKLKTYSYNVVIIYENFKGSTLQTNPHPAAK